MENLQTVSRRRAITTISTGIAVVLAGCSDESNNGPAASSESGTGPAATVTNFFTAVNSGDLEEAASYTLDESRDSDLQVDNYDQPSATINTIENQSVEEAADTASRVIDGVDTSVEEIESFGDQLANDFGYEGSQWTVVYFDVDINGAPEENYSWLVETEDSWKIGILALFGP